MWLTADLELRESEILILSIYPSGQRQAGSLGGGYTHLRAACDGAYALMVTSMGNTQHTGNDAALPANS